MIKGMTGFGSTELSLGKTKAVIEVKSLNHRYLDISYYLPTGFGSTESKIRQIVQKQLHRGRVTVSVRITHKPAQSILLNKEVVRQHLKHAKMLKKEFRLDNNLKLSDLVRLPGVLETKDELVDPSTIWPALEKSIKKAMNGLLNMRQREGKSLAADVADKLRRMSSEIKKIQSRRNAVLREKKKSLTADEFRSYQRSSDINEEISRLTHYVDELKPLLKSNVSVGKKIDFIAQEMQRETNTIGSKLQDRTVSTAVISIKSKIEKIREQSQNIE